MSKSTSWHSISSKSASCTSPSSPQWFASKCPITESSSGAMSQRGQGWLPFPWWLNTLLNNRSPLVCETSHHIWTVVCTIHSPDLLQVLSPLFMISNLSVKATPHISSNSLHSLTKRREEMVGYHTLLLVPPAFHTHTL